MKKILLAFTLMVLLASNAQAQTMKVEAVEAFSTTTPSSYFCVKIITPDTLDDGTILEKGAIVSGFVTNIQAPKRLKRDAYFEFIPEKVMLNGKTKIIEQPTIIAKVVSYEPLDKKELVEKVAKTVAGYAVKGATQGISLVQGMVENKDGNRLKSGVTNVYEDSPLSYLSAGSELTISPGDTIVIILSPIENGN